MQIQKNKKTSLCIVLIFAAIFGANRVNAATDSSRNELETIYQQYAHAIKVKDAKIIFSCETDDFSVKTLDGKTLNRQQADATVSQSFEMMKTVSTADVKVTEVKDDANQITAMVSQKIVAIITDPEGKEHSWSDTGKSRDTWVKVDGKLRIKFSEMLEDSQTIDGKSMQ